MPFGPRKLVQRLAYEFTESAYQRFGQHTMLALLASSPRYSDPRCLTRYGYRCFSQTDEDGIIDEIFRRIGGGRYFVEFGAQTGLQNNTLALLLAGWKGVWIEGDERNCSNLLGEFAEPVREARLTVLQDLVTAENVEPLFRRAGVPEQFDLLSIDIDGNDYWVWKAIRSFRPRVVVIEYNANLGRTARLVAPYDPNFGWDGSTRYGASLGALEELGQSKGYSLVGCNILGVNAFFVREDCLGDHFLGPYTAAQHYEPPRYGANTSGHRAAWGKFITP